MLMSIIAGLMASLSPTPYRLPTPPCVELRMPLVATVAQDETKKAMRLLEEEHYKRKRR